MLNKRIDELIEEIGPLRGIATEFSRMKIYRRVAEKLNDVCDGMYTLLCDNKSHIYKNSGDDKLSVLIRHLQEFNSTKIPPRLSKVRDNRELWNTINKETRKILQDEFNIKDINVFYEIVRIKSTRNSLSHTKDEATIDEIRTITKYATEIVDCISFNDSLN